jgi:hypothetical protein
MTPPQVHEPLIEHLLIILPILAGVVLKLSGITLIPKMMMRAFENLLNTSRLSQPKISFDEDQRALIIDTVSNEALKTTTILSYFIALFDAGLLLASHFDYLNLVTFSLFTILLLISFFYLLPKHPMELSEKRWLNCKLADLIIYSFCLVDLSLGILSLRN